MSVEFTATARRLGIVSASIGVVLVLAYAVTLVVGFLSLESPDQPIGDPMFSILETLIIVMMPALVALMVAVHAWAPEERKSMTLAALVFMGLLAGVTSCLHFVILTVSRQAAFAALPWFHLIVSFKWPSVAYAVDILSWDVFFALSMLLAAPAFAGDRLATSIRFPMIASGVLSLAGLSGVLTGDMQLRNIGVVGYVPVFLAIEITLGVLFYRTRPTEARVGGASS